MSIITYIHKHHICKQTSRVLLAHLGTWQWTRWSHWEKTKLFARHKQFGDGLFRSVCWQVAVKWYFLSRPPSSTRTSSNSLRTISLRVNPFKLLLPCFLYLVPFSTSQSDIDSKEWTKPDALKGWFSNDCQSKRSAWQIYSPYTRKPACCCIWSSVIRTRFLVGKAFTSGNSCFQDWPVHSEKMCWKVSCSCSGTSRGRFSIVKIR